MLGDFFFLVLLHVSQPTNLEANSICNTIIVTYLKEFLHIVRIEYEIFH